MKSFDDFFNYLLFVEGGYVNNPNDPGGETKYGISKRSYPDVDIKNLTKEEAKEIYIKDYWNKYKCNELPYPVNFVYVDAIINSGPKTSGKLLQESANVLGHNLVVDGLVGPKTRKAVSSIDPITLSSVYINKRMIFYRHIAKGRSKNFIHLWIHRLEYLFKEIFNGG